MKQFQFEYAGEQALRSQLDDLAATLPYTGSIIVHVLCDCWADDEVKTIARTVHAVLPESVVTGSATYGNLVEGKLSLGTVSIMIVVFEDPQTKVEGLYFPLESGTAQNAARELVKAVEERPWVDAVETLLMNNGEPTDGFREALRELRPGVEVFGGLAHFAHAPDAPKFVIDNDGNVLRWGVSFALFGGPNLHAVTRHIRGWRPLGMTLEVTRSTGNVIHELNGEPAHGLYERYLNIANDENFFGNAIAFPFIFNTGGTDVLRTPVACLEDGSIVLAASVPEGAKLRIAYGDPEEILSAVREAGQEIAAFKPDAVMLYSCGVRRNFWGDGAVDRETASFNSIAPAAGNFVAGELLRRGDEVIEFNSTLVVIGMREGEPDPGARPVFDMPEDRRRSKSLVERFAFFVDAAMTELEKVNDDLKSANETLERLSTTDELTGLYNRREIERRIREGCAAAQEGDADMPFVIMMDLDDFKHVNDTYGHREGDLVLAAFAKLLQELSHADDAVIDTGRWGGEEFILFARSDAPDAPERAVAFTERLRESFEKAVAGEHSTNTASFGVTRVLPGETPDAAIVRADEALYEAKRAGKNRVVVK